MSLSGGNKILTDQLIAQLTNFLNDNKPEEALNLFSNQENALIIKESSWDVIPIVSSYLTAHNAISKSKLFECCETILDIVAEKCHPPEIVLEFLEEIECLDDNDVKFCTLLKPLSKCLTRVDDMIPVVEWCFSTIRSYVDSLPLPANEKPKIVEENADDDMDPIAHRIINVYKAILVFLKPLVDRAVLTKHTAIKFRNHLQSLLISLLGKPLCYLDLSLIDLELSLNAQCPVTELIATYIMNLNEDVLCFFKIVDDRSNKRTRKLVGELDEEEASGNSEVNLFTLEENISNLAYTHFYFTIMKTVSLQTKIPQVYHPHYVLHSCFYLANCFLQKPQYVLIRKGLSFIKIILQRVDKFSLGPDVLELTVHSNLFGSITQIMIYCDSSNERSSALAIFKEYIELFNMQARYLVILHLYETSNHSGLLSVITTIFKASIMKCLDEIPHCTYFLGNKMITLLKRACRLPHGSASDLIEISDEVITSLNLLRFLTIRDKNNVTGIWNYVDRLEADYLKPLREGIDMARAHWKIKIKDLELQQKTSINMCKDKERSDAEVTITVGGEKLPMMPASEKIKFCYQAMNALDVLESILIRVNECIVTNPLK